MRSPRLTPPLVALVATAVMLTLGTYSVVRYRWWLVAGYVVVAAVLVVLARRWPDDREFGEDGAGGRVGTGDGPGDRHPGRHPGPHLARRAGAGVLVLVAVVHLAVPAFTYVAPGPAWGVRAAAAAAALLAAGALLLGRDRTVVALAALGSATTSVVVILGDPAPRIDVWVILQQAADGMLRGEPMYSATWVGSPGISDAFAYLPFTAVLTAPGRWLAGDVRWALALLVLLCGLALAVLGRFRVPAVTAAALLLLAPGGPTLVEQAWTEPTVLVGLLLAAVLLARNRAWWAVVPLAVALASKQHVVLLLPLLACWPRFGWRRTVVAAGGAGALMLPWFLATPADFVHDTVLTMLRLPPLRFADTVYILVLTETGVQLPFWVVGLAILAVVAVAARALLRRPVGLGGLLLWSATVLMVANLVNKQAFYNQFWLVAALVLAAVAVTGAGSSRPRLTTSAVRRRPAPPAARPVDGSAPTSSSSG
ncbi:hypothetical protein ACFFKU_11415 [Kineococcus gynurae]|uniref:DUF2029 domain-containing protein n=1 Tax=Kineococcus gynurae TaxID=452979 RepID=A0ABV5LUH1_9ACTN